MAREQLDNEEARVRERLADLDSRLAQLTDDIGREEQMIADNAAVLQRLDEEEAKLETANATMAERQASAEAGRKACEEALAKSEGALAQLTDKLADLSARRQQYQRSVIDAERRLDAHRQEQAGVTAELEKIGDSDVADRALEALRATVEAAQSAATSAETAALAAEENAGLARSNISEARAPLAEAEKAVHRIETEAATLVALLASSSADVEAPLVDRVKVEGGYEAALGAAFGDDLDSPDEAEAAAYWRLVDASDSDPDLPSGVIPLANHVEVPQVLVRRLAQTGLVSRTDGARLQSLLKPGQRLVSREGDLWRWDGYVAGADSPKASTQRLATRNRLAELEAEEAEATRKLNICRQAMQDADTALQVAETAERSARETWRTAQKELDQARAKLGRNRAERSPRSNPSQRAGRGRQSPCREYRRSRGLPRRRSDSLGRDALRGQLCR